jgi:hypothetical protein
MNRGFAYLRGGALASFLAVLMFVSPFAQGKDGDPIVISAIPTLGGPSPVLIINGGGFTPGESLHLLMNGLALTVQSVSSTQVVAALPPSVVSTPGTYLLVIGHGREHKKKDDDFATFDVTIGGAGQMGAPGAPGPQGIQGVPGATGAAGAQGLQGLQGLTGATGAVGPAGAQGVQGIQGVAGAMGPTGAQGAQGIQGNVGPTGAVGATGAQGVQGLAGVAGATGPTGAPGLQGFAGPTGALGATGPIGPQGSPGATGLGLTFRNAWASGTSYETNDVVTVAGTSYIATQTLPNDVIPPAQDASNWSVIAAAGAAGAAGARGSTGATGPQGLPGGQGLQGPQGAAGSTGALGPTGPATAIVLTAVSSTGGCTNPCLVNVVALCPAGTVPSGCFANPDHACANSANSEDYLQSIAIAPFNGQFECVAKFLHDSTACGLYQLNLTVTAMCLKVP